MSTGKHIDKLCLAVLALTLAVTILFMCGGSLGLTAAAKTVLYESTLFDASYVHQIDIVADDWEGFLETCENEDYISCTVVVDGKKHANTALRAKGNTSLSSVKASGSSRYSFKLEFDHYESAKSLDGLDKLCLNNLIQDNTMMKDYLVYRMMDDFGADSPLCSFAYLTVNGEDWGLYLAVEGVEDSFLARNYGSDTGELYKPDSMSFGGGRGNGKDFDFDALELDGDESAAGEAPSAPRQNGEAAPDGGQGFPFGGRFPGGFGPGGQLPEGAPPEGQGFGGQFPGRRGWGGQTPPDGQLPEGFGGGDAPRQGGFGGGRGSDDVKLKYTDDDPDSYSNIFDSAKTDVSAKDRERLIASLKKLSACEDLEDVLDMDEVLRYFVVHNFVCNGDSYTGSMIHNYYLHEKNGRLGMIPWDYNLAFGTFQGGSAASAVNASIDSPVSGGSTEDRPMVDWIFSDESYTAQYHALFEAFLDRWFANGELNALIEQTAELIRPYVEKDPTKFCTAEEFSKGVRALSRFVSLRGEAVRRQLDGDDSTVDTEGLSLSDMGSMGGGFRRRDEMGTDGEAAMPTPPDGSEPPSMPESGEAPAADGAPPALPGNGEFPALPEGAQTPAGGAFPGRSGSAESDGARPGGFGFPGGGQPSETPGAGQDGSSEAGFWVLVAVSVLALGAGLVVAAKKKY